MTYTLIAHTELTSSQANITFSSIPATFTDLVCLFSLRDNASGEARSFNIQLNSANPTTRNLVGTGSSTASYTESTYYALLNGSTATTNTFGNGSLYIPNYTGTAQKSVSMDMVTETNSSPGFQVITAALYNVTTAVTTLSLIGVSSSLVQFSSATLYGITAGSSGGVVVS